MEKLPVDLRSAIYSGSVFHRRSTPKAHGFRYGIYSLLLDLDELPLLNRTLRGFGYNRFAPFSFYDKDHGPRDGGNLKRWAVSTLAAHGIVLNKPSFRILCFPRVLGYTFDPISVWFCYESLPAKKERLGALIYEVHNTFGTDHSYVVNVRGADPKGPLNHRREKQLHVSPFFDTTGGYDFRLRPLGRKYHLNIRYYGSDGQIRMIADHQADRRPLTSRNLTALFWRQPLVTAKVIGAIHWEAGQLLVRKAAKYHHPSPPPASPSSAANFPEKSAFELRLMRDSHASGD